MPRGPLARVDAMPTRRAIPTLAAVTMIGAIVLASLAQVLGVRAAESRPPSRPRTLAAPVATPLVSVRRLAGTVAAREAVARIERGVATVVTALPADACLVVEVQGRRAVDVRGATAYVPGSNAKLAVAYGALARLGPAHAYVTEVLGDVRAGVVQGDLWLVGGGDPSLLTERYAATERYRTRHATPLERLADAVRAVGVTAVAGAVRGDGSRYDTERFAPGLADGIRVVEVGPIGGLLVDDGTVAVSPIKPADPAAAAAAEFARLLAERGIAVAGGTGTGTVPDGGAGLARVASITSSPLSDVVRDLLTNSDNNTAEMVLKEVGFAASGAGTREAGLADAVARLAADGVPTEGLVLRDGAGLHLEDRMSCDTLVGLLRASPAGGPLREGLAVASRTGTLRDADFPPAVGGTLRAKTGTLTGVKALSGVYPTAAGDDAIFSLLLNGQGTSTVGVYQPLWSSLGLALADAARVPSAASLAPVTPGG